MYISTILFFARCFHISLTKFFFHGRHYVCSRNTDNFQNNNKKFVNKRNCRKSTVGQREQKQHASTINYHFQFSVRINVFGSFSGTTKASFHFQTLVQLFQFPNSHLSLFRSKISSLFHGLIL